MRKKILAFVVDNGKFLALYSEPHKIHGWGGWFVVTGGVEEGESHEDAVVREILEETGLQVKEIMPLNWGSKYEWWGEVCEEINFIAFVKPGEVRLNEEHSKYAWLNLHEFVEQIKWEDDKTLLTEVLTRALEKKAYFKELKMIDYRK